MEAGAAAAGDRSDCRHRREQVDLYYGTHGLDDRTFEVLATRGTPHPIGHIIGSAYRSESGRHSDPTAPPSVATATFHRDRAPRPPGGITRRSIPVTGRCSEASRAGRPPGCVAGRRAMTASLTTLSADCGPDVGVRILGAAGRRTPTAAYPTPSSHARRPTTSQESVNGHFRSGGVA